MLRSDLEAALAELVPAAQKLDQPELNLLYDRVKSVGDDGVRYAELAAYVVREPSDEEKALDRAQPCLLYTSPSPRD